MRRILAVMLATGISLPGAAGDPAVLEIHLTEGDGATYFTGTRATRGITAVVTDETGRPVDGATVSFSLPPDGPGGVFASGSRTEIAITRGDGRAAAWGMQWNQSPGPFEVRITAVKGTARAGTTATLYLTSAANLRGDVAVGSSAPLGETRRIGSGHKWLWVSLAVAGAVAAGAAFAGGKTAASSTSSAPVTVPITLGSPSIILGPQ